MKYRLPIIPFGILLLVVSFVPDFSESTEVNVAPISPVIKKKKIDTIYQHFGKIFSDGFVKSKCPGAAIVIVKDTSVVYIKGLGIKSVNTLDPVDNKTIFRIGSLSKGFAGILTGKLIEDGQFSWDTKVQKHLPSFVLKNPAQASRIEVRHLLSHTTGLPRHSYTNLLEDGLDIPKILPMLKNVELISQEGKIMAYQNVAFSLIEEVIQAATDKQFNELLKEEIFVPANMNRTTLSFEDIKGDQNVALPHKWSSKNKKYYQSAITSKYYNATSAGGINTSISDMASWLMLLLGNQPDIISESTLESVYSPEINTTRNRRYFNNWPGVTNSYYAKGWRKLKMSSREIMYHGGYVNQYRSEVAVDRKNKLAICVLFNAPAKYTSKVVPSFFNYCDSVENLVTRHSTNSQTTVQ